MLEINELNIVTALFIVRSWSERRQAITLSQFVRTTCFREFKRIVQNELPQIKRTLLVWIQGQNENFLASSITQVLWEVNPS